MAPSFATRERLIAVRTDAAVPASIMSDAGAGGGAGAGAGGGAAEAEDVGVQFTIDGLCSTKHKRVRSLDAASLTPTTLANTTKEELCLEYVDNFQRQFAELFPDRPTPFLTAPNEAGVVKFLATTLRCTQLPYKELYGLQECATFISHFFTYEPLANPLRVPEVIPSPAVVLNWRIGDSFDMSFVLCSFLLGNGYDAYVVVGKAPRWITLRDQRRTECPFVVPAVKADEPTKVEEADGDEEDDVPPKYVAGDKGVPQSKYEATMSTRQVEESKGKSKDENLSDDEEPVAPPDPLEGRRVHAWVLVRAGPREVEDHVFVEPSTGRVFPVAEAPYTAVDSVINNKNCWVNMQPHVGAPSGAESGMGPVAFDLENADNWEYVFIREGGRGGGGEDNKDEADGKAGELDLSAALATKIDLSAGDAKDEDDGATDAHVLDLPPSWVPKLELERDAVEQECVGARAMGLVCPHHCASSPHDTLTTPPPRTAQVRRAQLPRDAVPQGQAGAVLARLTPAGTSGPPVQV